MRRRGERPPITRSAPSSRSARFSKRPPTWRPSSGGQASRSSGRAFNHTGRARRRSPSAPTSPGRCAIERGRRRRCCESATSAPAIHRTSATSCAAMCLLMERGAGRPTQPLHRRDRHDRPRTASPEIGVPFEVVEGAPESAAARLRGWSGTDGARARLAARHPTQQTPRDLLDYWRARLQIVESSRGWASGSTSRAPGRDRTGQVSSSALSSARSLWRPL
jgi:hypothetical protein